MKHLADERNVVRLYKFERLETTWRKLEYGMDDVGICACIDVETTGLDPSNDKVVEIAIQVVVFHKKTNAIVELLDSYESLNDPGFPIPPEASATHGIYDAHVKGHHIDWDRVLQMCESVDFCVAFNASFDCKFVQAGCIAGSPGRAPDAVWVCALNQVRWPHAPAKKLEVLAAWNGYWYDAHRAMVDVHMTLKLLEIQELLTPLLIASTSPSYEVQVSGGPRDEKSLAKLKTAERRFEWDRARTLWWRTVSTKEEAIDLVRYLDKYYDGKNQSVVREVQPENRFGLGGWMFDDKDMRKVWGV